MRAITNSPFKLMFSSMHEALLLLRWQIKVRSDGVQRGPQVISWSSFQERVKQVFPEHQTGVREWTTFLAGGLSKEQEGHYVIALAHMFTSYWPEALTYGPSADVERVANELSSLEMLITDTFPSLYTKAAQSIILAYLNEETTDLSFINDIEANLEKDPLSEIAQHVALPKNIMSNIRATETDKQRLQQGGVPYTLFLRGFSRMLYEAWSDIRHEPGAGDARVSLILEQLLAEPTRQLQQPEQATAKILLHLQKLPIWPTQEPVTYGAYLHWSLAIDSGTTGSAINTLTEIQGALHKDIEHKFYAERFVFDRIQQVSPSTFEVKVEFSIKYHVPHSQDYGYMLFVLVDFARQLGLSWRTSAFNMARIQVGLPPVRLSFGIHAGPTRTIELARRVAAVEGGICLTAEAYHHAKVNDLRVIWKDKQTVPASDDGPALPCYPIASIPSYLYFSLPRFLKGLTPIQIDSYSTLFKAYPSDTTLGMELAVHHYYQGDFRSAIDTLNTVLAIEPELPVAYDLLAYVCINRLAKPDKWEPSRWEEMSGHYRQAIAAIKSAQNSNKVFSEDFCDTAGIIYMRRGLFFFNDARLRGLEELWSERIGELIDFIRNMGIVYLSNICMDAHGTWNYADGRMVEVRQLVRNAALSDLYTAREYFNQGLTVSSTKSRSIFWRVLVDTLIKVLRWRWREKLNEDRSEVIGVLHKPRPEMLRNVFRETGLLSIESDEDEFIQTVKMAIVKYRATVGLERYLPQIELAFAVIQWDYVGPGKYFVNGNTVDNVLGSSDAKSEALSHINKAEELAKELGDTSKLIGPWLNLWDRKDFIKTCEKMRQVIKGVDGQYQNILPLYLKGPVEELMPLDEA